MIDSVRLRLTLWHVAVLALLLVGFSFSVYVLLSSALYGGIDSVLSSVVDGTVSMLAKESSEKKVAALAPWHTLKALSFPDTSLAILDGEGLLIAEKHAGIRRGVSLPAVTDLPLNKIRMYTVSAGPRGGVFRAAAIKVDSMALDKT